VSGKVFTTHQVAKKCNVHHTTVINWINEDRLTAYTTPGGHRRVTEEGLIRFMKKYQIPMPDSLTQKNSTYLL
jgi:excisionase family DNA binding protein